MDFTINYAALGSRRKYLVKAISEYMESCAEYEGTPIFAYHVDYITIDRDGNVSFDDRADGDEIEGLIEYLASKGFEPLKPAEPDTEQELEHRTTVEQVTTAAQVPSGSLVSDAADNGDGVDSVGEPEEQSNSQAEDAEQVEGATPTGSEATIESADAADGMDGMDSVDGVDGVDTAIDQLTITVPASDFTKSALTNLQKLIDSKASLLKKSLNTDDLSIQITDGKIAFPWFHNISPLHAATYTKLVEAICRMAKAAKRVTSVDKPVESEKYVMRIWLLRLGFNGPENKHARAILLQNLSGQSAFRYAAAAEEFSRKQKVKKNAKRTVSTSSADIS